MEISLPQNTWNFLVGLRQSLASPEPVMMDVYSIFQPIGWLKQNTFSSCSEVMEWAFAAYQNGNRPKCIQINPQGSCTGHPIVRVKSIFRVLQWASMLVPAPKQPLVWEKSSKNCVTSSYCPEAREWAEYVQNWKLKKNNKKFFNS